MEILQKQKLAQRIWTLKGLFLGYVDIETINYMYTQHFKDNPNQVKKDYKVVELTKSQREKSIEAMKYFIKDIQECIKHLEQ
jgi:hypothetical protein